LYFWFLVVEKVRFPFFFVFFSLKIKTFLKIWMYFKSKF
jgi:hypothetical protein